MRSGQSFYSVQIFFLCTSLTQNVLSLLDVNSCCQTWSRPLRNVTTSISGLVCEVAVALWGHKTILYPSGIHAHYCHFFFFFKYEAYWGKWKEKCLQADLSFFLNGLSFQRLLKICGGQHFGFTMEKKKPKTITGSHLKWVMTTPHAPPSCSLTVLLLDLTKSFDQKKKKKKWPERKNVHILCRYFLKLSSTLHYCKN